MFEGIIQPFLERHRVPGISVAVARRGILVHAAGYGSANLEHRVAATARTVYQTASVGKQFTAALILMMHDCGLLGIEDAIGPHFDGAPAVWDEVTVRHLLTHTSGIGDEGFEALNLRLDYSDDELLRRIAAPPLETAPGTAWSYSNSGYILLGLLVRRLTGRFYGDLLREWIFQPLGMTTARAIAEDEIVPDRAAGYRLEGGTLRNQEYVSPTLNRTADGGLYVTVLDLALWDRELTGGSLLTAASREAMWTPVRLADGTTYPYGLGWSLGTSARGRLVEHDGEWQGFSTHVIRYLEDGLSILALSNLADAPVAQLAQEIADAAGRE